MTFHDDRDTTTTAEADDTAVPTAPTPQDGPAEVVEAGGGFDFYRDVIGDDLVVGGVVYDSLVWQLDGEGGVERRNESPGTVLDALCEHDVHDLLRYALCMCQAVAPCSPPTSERTADIMRRGRAFLAAVHDAEHSNTCSCHASGAGVVEFTGQAVIAAVTDADTYEVDYFPEGRQPCEGARMTGLQLRDLLNTFERERWALYGTRDRFKAQRNNKEDGAQVYELRLIVGEQRQKTTSA